MYSNYTNFTETEFNTVMNIYKKNKEEFEYWSTEYGMLFVQRWHDINEDRGFINREFAYFMITSFITWMKSKGAYLRH